MRFQIQEALDAWLLAIGFDDNVITLLVIMKRTIKSFLLTMVMGLTFFNMAFAVEEDSEYRYVGGDISLLPLYEEAGAQYKTHDGKPISDVLSFCKEEGMNGMRVRVFVNPDDYDGPDDDPNACQTIESVIPLCKRIKDTGFALILDFMYSDTWADPAKQWTPKQWQGYNDQQLCSAVHEYTSQSLLTLKEAGVVPDFIQTGNEISYGMLWGAHDAAEKDLKKTFMGSNNNWARLGQLLNSATSACREICPDAKIIIHTERVAQPNVQRNFYNQMKSLGVDYDIIGISYYPYFHGSLSTLEKAIVELETDFPEKNIMVVETGYSYAWKVPGTNQQVDYPYSDEGQDQYAKDLVAMLRKHAKVDGLFWWWMEYNAYGTTLSDWYNAPLFDSRTGCATSALTTLCTFAEGNSGITSPIRDTSTGNVRWYNIYGQPVDHPSTFKGILIGTDGTKTIRK